jgi:NADPH2:quinone reductase
VRSERPGGYAEYVTVAAGAVAVLPVGIDPLGLASLGLASVTAFEGLRKIGALAGRRILVTGASGGVGSAGIALARLQGADVAALVSRASQIGYVRSLGARDACTAEDAERGLLGSESFDGILDSVAGPSFGAYVTALRRGGVLSLVGAVAGSGVSFDAYRLLDVTLTGYSSETLDGPSLRRAVDTISQWLLAGAIRPPARTIFPLRDAARAHAALERHEIHGRVLLVPG